MHCLRDPRRVHCCAQKCALSVREVGSNSTVVMLYVLALVGPPILHGYDACMVLRTKGASWRNCREKLRKTSFFFNFVFSLVGTI